MAYQPYPYGGYQPAPYYPGPVPDQLAQLRQSQVQQPMMQGAQMAPNPTSVQQQNILQAQQNSGMIWVPGKFDADNYLVAPNSAVALWDANAPVVYLRKADSTGKPSTVVYDLVERTDNPAPQQAAPQIDMSRYVTIDQLEEILSERLKKPVRQTKPKEDTENG